jgi:putative endopeptidase
MLAASSAVVLSFAATVALAADPVARDHFGTWGVDLSAGDPSVAPGDNFFRYGNGHWYDSAVIAPDQTSAGVGVDLYNRAQGQLRDLIESSARDPKTATARQVGGLYAAFMDEARVEALDAKPLAADLAAVAAVKDKVDFTLLMGRTAYGFGKTVFGLGVLPDPRSPEINTLFLGQDGLGLPDRDYYLSEAFKDKKAAYRAYVERTFALIGYPNPVASADAVLAFETKVAEASWAAADRRDIQKLINPMTLAQLAAYAPGIDWNGYLTASGIPGRADLIVGEKSAVQKITALYLDTPLDTLKAWESFHIADQASPYLSKRFVDSKFELSKALSGVQALRPRWKRGVALVDGSLGEVVGQEYVARYFPPASKAAVTDMIKNLKTAMAGRIQNAAWMSPATKAEALKKLAKMDVQVGYPDKWRDYSGLKITADDLYGDVERSDAFEWAYQISDLGRAVDHKKWAMTPQTVNAYNGGLENRIVFPAAILQAPYFDASADPAVNYGASGAIIGHEITHGFDDQGRKIDSEGALRDWWTAEDAKRFEAQAAKFGAQYDAYEGVPGFHVNGKLTMGENIADLGGLLEALDAYHASLHGEPAPVIDGLTGDQRFFRAFAQAWRSKVRADTLKQRMASDPHSPPEFRVIGPTRNIDAWYDAFGVKSGKYALSPEDRARIW